LFLGLDKKIEYMQNLGVKNIVLSSVFKADGNLTIDFMQVNASLGNENTMKELIAKLKAKGRLLKKNIYTFLIYKQNKLFIYVIRYESDVEISS